MKQQEFIDPKTLAIGTDDEKKSMPDFTQYFVFKKNQNHQQPTTYTISTLDESNIITKDAIGISAAASESESILPIIHSDNTISLVDNEGTFLNKASHVKHCHARENQEDFFGEIEYSVSDNETAASLKHKEHHFSHWRKRYKFLIATSAVAFLGLIGWLAKSYPLHQKLPNSPQFIQKNNVNTSSQKSNQSQNQHN